MIPAGFLPHLVTVATATTSTGVYGEQTVTYGTGASVAAYVQPAGGSEDTDARDMVTHRWRMFTNTPVTATDRVTWNGTAYRVDGPPSVWTTPSGETHYEATLVLVEG